MMFQNRENIGEMVDIRIVKRQQNGLGRECFFLVECGYHLFGSDKVVVLFKKTNLFLKKSNVQSFNIWKSGIFQIPDVMVHYDGKVVHDYCQLEDVGAILVGVGFEKSIVFIFFSNNNAL